MAGAAVPRLEGRACLPSLRVVAQVECRPRAAHRGPDSENKVFFFQALGARRQCAPSLGSPLPIHGQSRGGILGLFCEAPNNHPATC